MAALSFLAGGGVSGALARSVDWSKTALGAPEAWPHSLKTIVGVILQSRHPMFLWWGEDLVQIYNDAYLPSFGRGKHPAAMGQKGRDCWQEIWPIIGPQIDDVMRHGNASWNEDHLVPIFRNGHIEEVYWTYGYSPVHDDEGRIGGTLVVCTETTARVVAERRLVLTRSLALELTSAKDASEVTESAAELLAKADRDVSFAVLYAGGARKTTLGIDDAAARLVDDAIGDRRAGLCTLSTGIVAGAWPEPTTDVFVVPVDAGAGDAIAFGLSPRLPFDDVYRSFLEQIVGHVTNARTRARVESERRNLLLQAPVAAALLIGPEFVFEVANPLYQQMVGREVLGRKYFDAFPELRDSAMRGILERAYRRGEPFVTEELAVRLDRHGTGAQDCFFRFNLEPIRDDEGRVFGMMAVAVDITEQVSARLALERTNREREQLLVQLEAANRSKDEFLAMLGHELRNPLAPILTAVDLMKSKRDERTTREREIIARQASHLVRLVDDLLDVSRVAQGKIELRKTRLALCEVVARAVEIATPLFEKKAHRLVVDVPTEGLDLDGDPVRLSQVVANLLTNAARYTDEGGSIAVRGARSGDTIVLRVEDNGAGIPGDQLPRLFDAFFQGPRARDRAEGGLGLGLALVKSLVSLHGGEVSAHSDGPGKGSVFEVRLPRADGDTRPMPLPQLALPTGRDAVAGTRVLLVDDNPDIAELFAALLETFGFEVRTAHDGPSALEVAGTFHPRVAVLDIGLPVMDGYELAARMRERLGEAAPRLIAMTGYGQAQDRASSRAAGFELHLVKPVDADALVAAISERAS